MPKNLKYLFIAEFADGSVFEQTAEDVSKTDPKRNCYFDVLQMVKDGQTIRRFFLKGQGHIAMVDLGTGTFEVNGLPILLEGEKLPAKPVKFDLVWYHQVTRSVNVTFKTKSKEIQKTEDLPEFREYFIGWECEIAGKKYTQKLAIS